MDLKKLTGVMPHKWKINNFNRKNDPTQALCVAYVDSRQVAEFLDDVCGPQNWQDDYKEIDGNVYGGVGIKVGAEWLWKWDCGGKTAIEPEKGEASDAFKRAAVKWGVGRFLYNLPTFKTKVKKWEKNGKYYPCDDGGDILWNNEQLTRYIETSLMTTAINEAGNAKDLKTLTAIWKKYPALHGNERFIKAFKTFKLEITNTKKATA